MRRRHYNLWANGWVLCGADVFTGPRATTDVELVTCLRCIRFMANRVQSALLGTVCHECNGTGAYTIDGQPAASDGICYSCDGQGYYM